MVQFQISSVDKTKEERKQGTVEMKKHKLMEKLKGRARSFGFIGMPVPENKKTIISFSTKKRRLLVSLPVSSPNRNGALNLGD